MTVYKFKAVYTALGVGVVPSVAPVVTVVDTLNNVLVNAQPATQVSNITGLYTYDYTGASGLDLVALFHTTDISVDSRDLYSYTSDIIYTNLDVAVSTRATPADVQVSAAASVALSSVTAKDISAGLLSIYSYATLLETVKSTMLQDLSTATKLWFAIKQNPLHTDDKSLLFVEKTAGLTVVNKAPYAATTQGTLIVTGLSGAWEVAIMIDEVATGFLHSQQTDNYYAEVKARIGGQDYIVWAGRCSINPGIVQATQ